MLCSYDVIHLRSIYNLQNKMVTSKPLFACFFFFHKSEMQSFKRVGKPMAHGCRWNLNVETSKENPQMFALTSSYETISTQNPHIVPSQL